MIAASFLGACVAAVLLSRLDADYSAIIWRALARIGPAMVVLGLVGAVAVDRVNPASRVGALVAAVVAGVIAALVAWVVLPSATRSLMVATVRQRVGR